MTSELNRKGTRSFLSWAGNTEQVKQILARYRPTEQSGELPGLKPSGPVKKATLGEVLDQSFLADVPPPIRGDGLFVETSSFDETTGFGYIRQMRIGDGAVVDNELRPFTAADPRKIVDVEATGRRVIPFGYLRAWRAQTGEPEQQRVKDLRVARFLLAGAGRLIPQSERDRYLEEFHAELLDLPRRGRLRHALSMLRGVLVLRLRNGFKNTAGAARKA